PVGDGEELPLGPAENQKRPDARPRPVPERREILALFYLIRERLAGATGEAPAGGVEDTDLDRAGQVGRHLIEIDADGLTVERRLTESFGDSAQRLDIGLD